MINRNQLRNVSVMALALGLLILGVGPSLAFAHDRYDERYDGRYVRREGERIGYEYGFRHGREDRYARIGYRYKSHEYREALAGYNPRLGHRRDYQRGFRDGYRAGYDAGFYDRRGYYGRGGGYR